MDDELQLAALVSEKDPIAIDRLAALHLPSVYRFLRQLTRSVDDAEDLAQQTLIRALAGAKSYDGRASLRSWMLAIAFREFTKWRRKRPWLPLLGEHALRGDPFKRLDEKEVLLAALQKLKPELQSTILLHFVEQMSIAEIAEVTNVPEGTVKSRLHTAKARMRQILGAEEMHYVHETI